MEEKEKQDKIPNEKESFLKKLSYFNIPMMDKYRKIFYQIHGDYKPTIFKRAICYIMNEKLFPIDWEEVPPFEEYVEPETDLVRPKYGRSIYVECRSQPDMLSEGNIFARKIFLIFVTLKLFRFMENHSAHFSKYIFLGPLYYHTNVLKYFITFWIWNIFCLWFANRKNQVPFNSI